MLAVGKNVVNVEVSALSSTYVLRQPILQTMGTEDQTVPFGAV